MAAAVASASAQGLPGYVILPLSAMGHSNQATLRMTVNNQSTMLIVDTGATGTMLDAGLYKAAQVRSGEAAPGQLPAGVGTKFKANGEPAEIGYVDSLKAGGAELGKWPVAVMDLSGAFARYNNMHGKGAVGGLLGEDVLHKYAAIIDWRRRGVYFNLDPSKRVKLGPSLVASGWTEVPMYPTNSRHFAVACIVEGKPVRLIVDTGATYTSFVSGVVPLTMDYNHDKRGSMVRLASNTGTLRMIGLDSAAHPATVEHWKIGNYEIASANVAVSKIVPGVLEEKSGGEGPVLGLLGAEVLAQNNAIIDIGDSAIYFKHASK